MWQYRDYKGTWRNMSAGDQPIMEAAHTSDPEGVIELPLGKQGFKYILDMKAKRQRNVRTGQWRAIRRLQFLIPSNPEASSYMADDIVLPRPFGNSTPLQKLKDSGIASVLSASPRFSGVLSSGSVRFRLDLEDSETPEEASSTLSPSRSVTLAGVYESPTMASSPRASTSPRGQRQRSASRSASPRRPRSTSSSWSREPRSRDPTPTPGPTDYETVRARQRSRSASIGRSPRRVADWFSQPCMAGRSASSTPSPNKYEASKSWSSSTGCRRSLSGGTLPRAPRDGLPWGQPQVLPEPGPGSYDVRGKSHRFGADGALSSSGAGRVGQSMRLCAQWSPDEKASGPEVLLSSPVKALAAFREEVSLAESPIQKLQKVENRFHYRALRLDPEESLAD